MDNYFQTCPPMMDDGRLFTDYRSSQVREELFRYKNCVVSENEARTIRAENGDSILDNDYNITRDLKSCWVNTRCFHNNPITRVTTAYNNAELLACNGDIPAPKCNVGCYDYRATITKGALQGRPGCHSAKPDPYAGYSPKRCPVSCARTSRLKPERLYPDYE
jgi:hypothetical protein